MKHPSYSDRAWNSLPSCIVIFYLACVYCKQNLYTLDAPSYDEKYDWLFFRNFQIILTIEINIYKNTYSDRVRNSLSSYIFLPFLALITGE